jgi:hypothetical protein
MTVIAVLSCKGNIIKYIHRANFEKDMLVPYSTSGDASKGKNYRVKDMRRTNLNEFAIYPWGTTCGKRGK